MACQLTSCELLRAYSVISRVAQSVATHIGLDHKILSLGLSECGNLLCEFQEVCPSYYSIRILEFMDKTCIQPVLFPWGITDLSIV